MIKPGSILEISIGDRSNLYATKGSEWDVFVGIDIDMELCRQAKKQGLEVVCCDAFNLPFKPKSFQDVYVQCFTALLEKDALHRAFMKSDYDEFCEFMGSEIDYAWILIDPFHELLMECRQAGEHLTCLPSCNLEMNKYLVNAVKSWPNVTIDVELAKVWGKGRARTGACVMYLYIDCTIRV
ncbi:MAG: class I SAM-dependent methyltransferase [Candidatus Methanoperedens sp.]|nr:class I SAM-dependent methyltransferase [Candidatus Methanoperedens sp.]